MIDFTKTQWGQTGGQGGTPQRPPDQQLDPYGGIQMPPGQPVQPPGQFAQPYQPQGQTGSQNYNMQPVMPPPQQAPPRPAYEVQPQGPQGPPILPGVPQMPPMPPMPPNGGMGGGSGMGYGRPPWMGQQPPWMTQPQPPWMGSQQPNDFMRRVGPGGMQPGAFNQQQGQNQWAANPLGFLNQFNGGY